MTIRNRTANIKAATRNAMLDQLAAIATGIIHERIATEIALRVAMLRLGRPRRWWQRFAWWRA